MSILPGKFNLIAVKGSTFQKRITYYVDEEGTTPYNLTGYTADLVIHSNSGSTLRTMTTENGGIALGGATGTIDLLITATDTTNLTWSTGLYSLTIESSAHVRDTILRGGFSVRSY